MLRAVSQSFPIPPGYTGQVQPYIISEAAIPFITASSGTMGNNGAVSALTALGLTYASAYIHLPASAISAGSSAGWYFCQMSSTTAGTVFNNTYTSGPPTVPASPTPFVTTGPGAFIGETAEVNGVAITVPANSFGPNGALKITTFWSMTNNANVKTLRYRFSGGAGTVYGSVALASTLIFRQLVVITNRGLTNSQFGGDGGGGGWSTSTGAMVVSAVDTTASSSVVMTGQKATATDNLVLESYVIEALYGA